MATYLYRCPECAVFERQAPMAAVTSTSTCPGCGAESARVYTAPSLTSAPAALTRAAETAGSSADSPTVTRSLPGAHSTPRGRTPTGTPLPLRGESMSPAHPPLPRS